MHAYLDPDPRNKKFPKSMGIVVELFHSNTGWEAGYRSSSFPYPYFLFSK